MKATIIETGHAHRVVMLDGEEFRLGKSEVKDDGTLTPSGVAIINTLKNLREKFKAIENAVHRYTIKNHTTGEEVKGVTLSKAFEIKNEWLYRLTELVALNEKEYTIQLKDKKGRLHKHTGENYYGNWTEKNRGMSIFVLYLRMTEEEIPVQIIREKGGAKEWNKDWGFYSFTDDDIDFFEYHGEIERLFDESQSHIKY